jgi:hypothetical protein
MTSRFKTRVAVAVASMSLFCGGAVLPAAAATDAKPTAVKVSPKDIQELKKAIDPVLKEGQEAFTPKDAKNPGKLREKSDLWSAGKLPDGITIDIVLAGLTQQMSTDPRIDAYVKWEMLSGVPNPTTDEILPRVVEAYRAAPKPLNHPGLDHAMLQAQLNKAGNKDRHAIEPINDVLDKMAAQYETNNDPVMKYRNDLLSRLPTNASTIQAEVEDLYYRVSAATPSKPMFDRLREKLKTWAVTAKPNEVNSVIPVVAKIGDMAKNDKYKAYTRVEWIEKDKKRPDGLYFVGTASFEPKYYDQFVSDLKDAARGGNPALTGGSDQAKMDTKKKG